MEKNMSDQDGIATQEQSMTPPTQATILQEFKPPEVVGSDDILMQFVNLNEKNVLHEPTCIICSNPHREEIEKRWIETKNHENVKDLFRSKSTIPISNDVIDNHMRFHYDRGIKELQKVEYINRIQRASDIERTTLDRIRLGLSAIDERIMGINSITPTNDLSSAEVEKIKSSEVAKLMVAYNQLLKLKATIIGEMKNSGELIIIPKRPFIDTFNAAIIESKNEEEKEVIKKLLSKLADLNKKTQ